MSLLTYQMDKKISILGSTGSIGINCLKVVKNLNSNGYGIDIVYLTTNKNIEELSKQIEEFKPKAVVITNAKAYSEFIDAGKFKNIEVIKGDEGLLEICKRDNYDILVSSLVGFAGLMPTIEALKTGKRVALANKETLVTGGKIIYDLIAKYKSEILPIDSEHSAILQCLTGEDNSKISKLILTASGGPFRNLDKKDFRNISIEQALNHPNWKMGKKITIDSATLMNKGLEVIEAKWLFNLDVSQIEILVHPQSIIHSMVEFVDGSIKAQLGIPDMRIPIQYAITYPERIQSDFPRMDFRKYNTLCFEEPDFDKFECLKIAYDVIRQGGTYPTVMNAANEIAIELFLNSKVKFIDIPAIIKNSLDSHVNVRDFDVEDILYVDKNTRNDVFMKYSN
jgi:1-deoxy-D-xylulose-5-phosphate reductoisomerase